ncbi:protein spire isoform X2 [Culicoides brevitarsis]|uniref:protein spire isoform X2 n=1 Tax=Culicoides brevitarsis TaxID=469753 RepID=UPI00307BA28A
MTDECQSTSKEPSEASDPVKMDKNLSNKLKSAKADMKDFSVNTKCEDAGSCVTLESILKSFNNPISEEQAWAILYQSLKMYRDFLCQDGFTRNRFHNLLVPAAPTNLNLHKDGSVHFSFKNGDTHKCSVSTQKKILLKLGVVIYNALDFNLGTDEDPLISGELEQVIHFMTTDDADDEGIEWDSEDIEEDKHFDTKDLDHVLQLCSGRLSPISSNHQARSSTNTTPDDHYKAVCRALATESLELKIFLEKVLHGDAQSLQIKAQVQESSKELGKLSFSEWARFWMQVVDELRRGVRLKKIENFSRTPTEYELTPYEILMEDIRQRKYQLRKVMVNGDIPPRVKKDAHAVILEFIRSRPPLRKASERKLQPLKRNPSPRDLLLDSIRQGRVLKPVAPKLKNRLLPTTIQLDAVKKAVDETNVQGNSRPRSKSPRNTLRLIPVDLSLLQDNDFGAGEDVTDASLDSNQLCSLQLDSGSSSLSSNGQQQQKQGQTSDKRNNENNQNNINTVLRRTTYDLATQCESRRSSMRRHTIVGCSKSFSVTSESKSLPGSRPDSRQRQNDASPAPPSVVAAPVVPEKSSEVINETHSEKNSQPEPVWTNSLDELQWKETLNATDKLSLTLDEIIHIRSVMTKAELEGLPVGIKIKEEVERRKLCFLCLRTRFSLFGQRGVNCKLCDRTVCIKCFTKMRIPREHFRHVPVVLLSPSILSSPAISNTPSPIHHAQSGGFGVEESFSRTLMERLMRPEMDRKSRNTVGSAPSSPKNQRSNSVTPMQHPNKMSMSLTGTLDNNNKENGSIMSQSIDGPKSMTGSYYGFAQSPAKTQSNCSTLDRKSRFSRGFTLTMSNSSQAVDVQKENLRGELMAVCNDCRSLVLEIIRSSKQTRSSARNYAIKNLTLDLSPVYKSNR